MTFELPKLPYPIDALAPHISSETLAFHHGKHHATYVKHLNDLVDGTRFEHSTVEEIMKSAAPGALFNNAAQYFNHSFYWTSLKPKGGDKPGGELGDAIKKVFGNFANLRKKFSEAAATHFGSGWVWLILNVDGSVAVESTHDADSPIVHGKIPLLTCDLWEHAYYIDYRSARERYVEAFWNIVNWNFAGFNFS